MPEREGREGCRHGHQPCWNDIPRLRLDPTLIRLALIKINVWRAQSGTYLDKFELWSTGKSMGERRCVSECVCAEEKVGDEAPTLVIVRIS